MIKIKANESMKNKPKIEQIKTIATIRYARNSRTHSEAQVAQIAGSGTTLIAAEKNGRIARLMELDLKYCDVIVTRWQDFAGKKATLEASGKNFDELKAAKA